MRMIELSDANFENEVMKSPIPVIVDFWAPWCGPCRIVGPMLEKLSSEYTNKLKFAKMNVDNFIDIASRYDIRSIPCMILFRQGAESDRIIGAYPESELRKRIDMAMEVRK